MEDQIEKLVIIGSGPAGLTAAIYAARGGLDPVVVTGRTPGGQLTLTTDVDDFPGFPEGIQGPELMKRMMAQAEKFTSRFIEEDVINVDFKKHPFEIETESKKLKVWSVILATGASAKWLGLPSEQRLIGRGVSACAVCDGPFFKGKNIIIVGGGDSAMREAQYLSKFAQNVTIVHRRDQFSAQEALQETVKAKQNVKFLFNSTIEEVLGEERVMGVKIKDTKSGEVSEMPIDGVFLAIGHRPNTDFLHGQLEVDGKGYVVVHDGIKTSVEGVFAAGDVADYKYRQGVSAAGAGCQASLDAQDYLEKLLAQTTSESLPITSTSV